MRTIREMVRGIRLQSHQKVMTFGVLCGAVMALAAGVASSSAATSHAAASKGPWTIGISNGYFGNAARKQFEADAQAYAALPSVKPKIKQLIINNAGTSVAAQISAVDQMIAEHVNAIILDSNSVTALNAAIAQAHQAGIPVITANDQVSSPLAYHIETLGKQFGKTMAQGLVTEMHGKGNIVVLRGIAGNAVDAAEASGFMPVLKAAKGIHILATAYANWDDAQAQQTMANLLSRYPKINGVFTEGGMAQGAVRAFLAAHRKLVPVTSTDENGFACQVKKYRSQGLGGVQVDSATWAYALGVRTALQMLSGKSVPHQIPINFVSWNTKQSAAHCQPKVSPSLFLSVSSPSQGINLTPAQVEKFLK